MTKILFLADLHGNYTATKAMEKEIEKIKPDEIWFLGDAVGKGPRNDLTCDWVREHCDHHLKGNWDEWICRAYRDRDLPDEKKNRFDPGLRFYWEQMGGERVTWLNSLSQEDSIWISGLHFRLIHGRTIDALYQPSDPTETLEKGLIGSDGKTKYDAVICADCHRTFIRALNYGYALNTGSIGNAICRPWASVLLIEGEKGAKEPMPIHMTSVCVPYDNQAEADVAANTPNLPLKESYITEVLTGEYSR